MKIKISLLSILMLAAGSLLSQAAPSFTVRVSGTGTRNVILIPGYTCSGDVWEGLTAKLSGNYKFHTLTFAGFAGEVPQTNPSLQTWIDDVANYITSHQLKQPVVIGHSLGGVIAMDLAARFPSLISKIIVVDAVPSLSAVYNPSFKADEKPECSAMVMQFTSLDQKQFYAMQQNSIRSLMADTVNREKAVSWSVKSDRNTLAQIYCQFLNLDVREKLSSIKCPSLILLEPLFKANASVIEGQFKLLEDRYKKIHYASKGLHFIMYDDADWFMNEVSNFLN